MVFSLTCAVFSLVNGIIISFGDDVCDDVVHDGVLLLDSDDDCCGDVGVGVAVESVERVWWVSALLNCDVSASCCVRVFVQCAYDYAVAAVCL